MLVKIQIFLKSNWKIFDSWTSKFILRRIEKHEQRWLSELKYGKTIPVPFQIKKLTKLKVLSRTNTRRIVSTFVFLLVLLIWNLNIDVNMMNDQNKKNIGMVLIALFFIWYLYRDEKDAMEIYYTNLKRFLCLSNVKTLEQIDELLDYFYDYEQHVIERNRDRRKSNYFFMFASFLSVAALFKFVDHAVDYLNSISLDQITVIFTFTFVVVVTVGYVVSLYKIAFSFVRKFEAIRQDIREIRAQIYDEKMK